MSGAKLALFGAILAWSSCFCLQPARAQITDPSEVSALKAIWSNLVDPMNKLNTWNSGDPCMSNWTGVICYNSTSLDGYLHIQELQLNAVSLFWLIINKVKIEKEYDADIIKPSKLPPKSSSKAWKVYRRRLKRTMALGSRSKFCS